MFQSLHVHNWRQFETVDIQFHPRLTVLTGANGAGKTTLLHILIRHWGWDLKYVSTPIFQTRGVRSYWAGFWGKWEESSQIAPQEGRLQIGHIGYSNGQTGRLWLPKSVEEVFGVEIENQNQIAGVYVPSHRPPYVFQKVEQIPAELDAKEQIFATYLEEIRRRYMGNQRVASPSFRLKSSLISLATFGYGNEASDRNEDAVRTFEGFERVLRIVLPSTLGFERIRIRVPDVLLQTTSGDFSFDAVSGGIAALIDLSWQIYLYSLLNEQFVVVVDEPEAHLHPALQQRLLPDLLTAFPNSQFIIATHNPFMVASVPDSNVYVLRYNHHQKVESDLLDVINKAGTANEILRDVLGVPSATPIWVRSKIEEAANRFAQGELTEASLRQLRDEMTEIGLGHLFPDAFERVLKKKNDSNS